MANYKLLIGISAALVAGLGGYYLYKTKFKTKEDADDTAPETEPASESPKPISTVQGKAPGATSGKPKVNKPAPTPVRDPGFVQPPKGPQSVAVKAPAMGTKIFVLSASGANAYKAPAATQANVYKFYKKGAYVGTYLSQRGSFSEVIVQETNAIGMTSNKAVFLRSTEIYT